MAQHKIYFSSPYTIQINFVPIAQQAGQAVGQGRLSLCMCLVSVAMTQLECHGVDNDYAMAITWTMTTFSAVTATAAKSIPLWNEARRKRQGGKSKLNSILPPTPSPPPPPNPALFNQAVLDRY